VQWRPRAPCSPATGSRLPRARLRCR
jgi:hypothetical protein